MKNQESHSEKIGRPKTGVKSLISKIRTVFYIVIITLGFSLFSLTFIVPKIAGKIREAKEEESQIEFELKEGRMISLSEIEFSTPQIARAVMSNYVSVLYDKYTVKTNRSSENPIRVSGSLKMAAGEIRGLHEEINDRRTPIFEKQLAKEALSSANLEFSYVSGTNYSEDILIVDFHPVKPKQNVQVFTKNYGRHCQNPSLK